MKFSKLIVAAIVAMNAAFAVAVLYIFARVGSEPAVLIGAWFAFTTGELWALASIRKTETKQKNEKGENEV